MSTVKNVYYQLENTTHNGFPVLDKKERLIGLVERDVLITLISKMAWYYPKDDKVPMFGDGIVFNRNNSLESNNHKTLRAGSTETHHKF